MFGKWDWNEGVAGSGSEEDVEWWRRGDANFSAVEPRPCRMIAVCLCVDFGGMMSGAGYPLDFGIFFFLKMDRDVDVEVGNENPRRCCLIRTRN